MQFELSYGFIQVSSDSLVGEQVEIPFWALVADAKWKNVDTDMKEALHRRDTDARDPAFYAARALESVLKILSDEKKRTHGKERGAHSFIDNLSSRKSRFIDGWEADALKGFFSEVRNLSGMDQEEAKCRSYLGRKPIGQLRLAWLGSRPS